MEETVTNIKEYPWQGNLLDTIRQRPGMYLGENSLTALWFFLHGYEMAALRRANNAPREVPKRFADWVGYRLHLHDNRSGFWKDAILSKVRDESLALDRFFELRDEFLSREAKVVATVRRDRREHQVTRGDGKGGWSECTELLPESLQIVVYTEDPGFFLVADEGENFFYNGWFVAALESWIGPSLQDRFEIADEVTWARLLAENKRYKRNLARVKTRIQKKDRCGNTPV